jgi:predicted dehydrogenase
VAKRFEIPQVFDELETMLHEAELDFVDICTRPYSHAPLTKLAAEQGLPVLCQKPFCQSLAEAQELVEHCERAGVRLMINENCRWQAWYRQVKEVLSSGVLGRPFFARVHRRFRMTLPEFEHNQAYLAEMPRLILYESGVHLLDTFRFLFGEPDSVFARLHRVSPHIKGEDVELITLNYPDLTCLINHSWASVQVSGLDRPEDGKDIGAPRLEIDGTQGTLSLDCKGLMRIFTDGGQRSWHFPVDTVPESHIAAQQHFINCLESGAEFETSGAETLKTMALVYAGYRSAEEERVVYPKQM